MYQKSHNFDGKSVSKREFNGRGQTATHPLVNAASRNDLDGIQRELKINYFSNDDYVSAISRAGGHGHLDALKLLTQQPFNRPEDNEKSMRWAARHAKFDCLKYFIEVLHVPATCFKSASLRMAAQHGHLREMVYLHELGADIRANDDEAIKSAVRFYHDDVAEYLIKSGADFSLSDEDLDRDKRYAKYISGTNTGNNDNDRWDLFYRVATKSNGMEKTFKAMLDRGVPQIALDTASIKVASYGLLNEYIELRKNGADVNAQNVAGLSEAARFGHKNMVLHFLDNEPEIDRVMGIQRALKKAIEGNHDDVAQTLMLRINDETGSIGNPDILLDRFLRFKQMSSAEEIINQNIWLIFEDESAPLKIVRYGSPELLQKCIESGMKIIETDENFVDAALERFNFDNARILIEEGVSPSNLNQCMVNAAKFGKADIMTYMLEAGARGDFNNNEALANAVNYDHVVCAKVLRFYNAEVSQDLFDNCKSNEMRDALELPMNKIKGEVKLMTAKKIAVGG
jgi:hypothetical protein